MRAKDRELAAAQQKLAVASQIEAHNKELENDLLSLRKSLADVNSEVKTLQQVTLEG